MQLFGGQLANTLLERQQSPPRGTDYDPFRRCNRLRGRAGDGEFSIVQPSYAKVDLRTGSTETEMRLHV